MRFSLNIRYIFSIYCCQILENIKIIGPYTEEIWTPKHWTCYITTGRQLCPKTFGGRCTVAEKDKRRAGAKITSCQGNTYGVSRQITAYRGKLRRVEANYGVSGQITACRGKLRRVGANYGVSGQITACRGKLRRVGANYGVSGQITACRGKLRSVGENYGMSGHITARRGKLRRVGANYDRMLVVEYVTTHAAEIKFAK